MADDLTKQLNSVAADTNLIFKKDAKGIEASLDDEQFQILEKFRKTQPDLANKVFNTFGLVLTDDHKLLVTDPTSALNGIKNNAVALGEALAGHFEKVEEMVRPRSTPEQAPVAHAPVNITVTLDPGIAQSEMPRIQNMDFSSLPTNVFDAAVNAAKELMAKAKENHIDLTKTEIGQFAGSLDKTGKITEKDLAAVILAEDSHTIAMGINNTMTVIDVRNKNVTLDLGAPAHTGDIRHLMDGKKIQPGPNMDKPEAGVVFEVARQIMKNVDAQDMKSGDVNVTPAAAKSVLLGTSPSNAR